MADAPGVRHFLTLSVIGPGAVLTEVVFILNALGRWARSRPDLPGEDGHFGYLLQHHQIGRAHV